MIRFEAISKAVNIWSRAETLFEYQLSWFMVEVSLFRWWQFQVTSARQWLGSWEMWPLLLLHSLFIFFVKFCRKGGANGIYFFLGIFFISIYLPPTTHSFALFFFILFISKVISLLTPWRIIWFSFNMIEKMNHWFFFSRIFFFFKLFRKNPKQKISQPHTGRVMVWGGVSPSSPGFGPMWFWQQ